MLSLTKYKLHFVFIFLLIAEISAGSQIAQRDSFDMEYLGGCGKSESNGIWLLLAAIQKNSASINSLELWSADENEFLMETVVIPDDGGLAAFVYSASCVTLNNTTTLFVQQSSYLYSYVVTAEGISKLKRSQCCLGT